MNYEAILFDLDGTLLGIDTDDFTQHYIKLLVSYMAPFGYDPHEFVPTMWNGVQAMVQNDGTKANIDRFYDVFRKVYGQKAEDDIDIIIDFYKNDFDKLKMNVDRLDYAKELVQLARKHSKHVILATNPFFPKEALITKLNWLGLTMEDFDLVTHYENSSFCKPNPKYYETILKQFNLQPHQCLMVGNDVQEDIEASVGLNHFLITNYIIHRKDEPLTMPHGDIEDFKSYLKRND